jgi:hypothetical protein
MSPCRIYRAGLRCAYGTSDKAGSEHHGHLLMNPEYEAFGNHACSGHRNFSLGPCRVVLDGRKLVEA